MDLFAVERLLQRPINRRYDQFFARKLWDKVIERSKTVPGAPSVDHLPRPRKLREFDSCYTVRLAATKMRTTTTSKPVLPDTCIASRSRR